MKRTRPFLQLKAVACALPALFLLQFHDIHADDFSARFEEIKKKAAPAELYAFLYRLPKGGDLHHHMGGANWPELWYKVATDLKIARETFYARTKLPALPEPGNSPLFSHTIGQAQYDILPATTQADYTALTSLTPGQKERFLSDLWLDRPGKGRDEFFDRIFPRLQGMAHNPYVCAELLVENMKLYGAEGGRYLETQAFVFGIGGSQFLYPDGKPVPEDDAAQIFRARLAKSDARATGVTVRFQSIVLRFTPGAIKGVEEAYAVMDRNRDLFVGINMAGREDNEKGYPSQFTDVYRRMRARYPGFQISIHAGENDEPNFHVRDTLYLGATRIGHGVNLQTDPATMLQMRAGGNLVEINLISNKLLEYTPDLAKHPFPDYLRFGIPVCLNTDDRGMWGSDLTDEYFTAVQHFNLNWNEIVLLGRNSLAYSFAEPSLKQNMLADYHKAIAAFTAQYDTDGWKKAVSGTRPLVTAYARREFALDTK